MKRILLGIVTVSLVGAAVAFSGGQVPVPKLLRVQSEAKNPWTSLRLNNAPEEFQFAIVSDRTGGHRAKIFSLAVEQLNLLQPQFVLSVGDLIEGYKEDTAKLAQEWQEFQGYVSKLQMPFFYVPGNHDLANAVQDKTWQERFGRRYYHFVYRDVLFLMLNSNDPAGAKGKIGPDQVAYVQKVLDENRNARWTLVFLHHPIWTGHEGEKAGWLEVEKALGDRPYTVFAGHIHHYQKFVRNGHNYYQLATTGGASKIRGLRYGEFDHIVWVTMKKDGPRLANILLDGVLPEDLRLPESREPGVPEGQRKPVYAVHGRVTLDGKPAANVRVIFQLTAGKGPTADGLTDENGNYTLSTYKPDDGAAAGEYTVTFSTRPGWDGQPPAVRIPAVYGSANRSPLRATVGQAPQTIDFELRK